MSLSPLSLGDMLLVSLNDGPNYGVISRAGNDGGRNMFKCQLNTPMGAGYSWFSARRLSLDRVTRPEGSRFTLWIPDRLIQVLPPNRELWRHGSLLPDTIQAVAQPAWLVTCQSLLETEGVGDRSITVRVLATCEGHAKIKAYAAIARCMHVSETRAYIGWRPTSAVLAPVNEGEAVTDSTQSATKTPA